MKYDTSKVDEAALALLYLNLHDYNRAWKGLDWDIMNRLHEKGFIYDPVNKAKSVVFTADGLKKAEERFNELFMNEDDPEQDT